MAFLISWKMAINNVNQVSAVGTVEEACKVGTTMTEMTAFASGKGRNIKR